MNVAIRLSGEQLALLAEALDSHIYWQLSDPAYRDSGSVRGKGSDDPENRKEIRRAERLLARLEEAVLATRCPAYGPERAVGRRSRSRVR